MTAKNILTVASFGLLMAVPLSGQAFDLGKLLKGKPDGGAKASASGKAGVGSSMTEQHCRQMFSVAGINKKKPVDPALVLEEFNFSAPGDIFDAYLQAKTAPSFAFPSPRFYQGEFETDRINVLYDLILSYPSPQYVASLIAEARKENGSPQYDHQAKVDALAALTILHYSLQDRSRTPDRWKQLAAQLQAEEHYTARVITARLLAAGELGVKDSNRALSYANEANGLRQKYSSESGYRTMSPRNYTITSNHTLYEVTVANPRAPQARYFTQFAQQYGATLKNPILAPELEAQLGPGIRSIEKSSGSAARKASELLAGAQQVSLLKAEKNSLDSAVRNRVSDTPTDVNVDDKTMLSITRQLEKLNTLDQDQKQKFASALADAHESGDKAIAMMPVMMSSMMNLMMQRGIAAMPALLPYSKKLQYHSDNACSVVARWDQAAQVTKASEDTSRTSLASLVADSN